MKYSYLVLLSLVATTFVESSESDLDPVSPVTTGQNAKPNQFPYHALIKILISANLYFCGGTLISDQWILTAAHCFQRISSFEVCLGNIHLDCNDGVVLKTAKYLVHADFNNPTKFANDIALIELESPVNTSSSIQPAKLPAYSSTPPTYEGKTAVTSGWGYFKTGGSEMSKLLQYISVPIISNEKCRQAAQNFRDDVQDTNICIGTDITLMSPCHGDSGGPLVLDNDTLIGITSFGSNKGCERGYPVAFTRITSYLDWIKDMSGVST